MSATLVLESAIKQRAHELGFALAGIAAATPADGFERYLEWLDRGCAGEMTYLQKQPELRRQPSSIFPDVRSVIMVGMNYGGGAKREAATGLGRVARYAHGRDYHEVLWEKLDQLLAWLKEKVPGANGRGVVDSAPLLERDFARRAGLGWFGKNTMLINKREGSFFFIGALLVDVELPSDAPHSTSHCGSCTACLDACPTQAFTSAGWLDARRCISYLTIELRAPIPEPLRPGLGDWLFGCDVCQDVCPWNRKAHSSRPVAPQADGGRRLDLEALDPIELLGVTEEEFRLRFRHTALWRTKRRGLLRNAALVLGNTGGDAALPALRCASADPEILISEAATWAIEQILRRQTTAEAEPRSHFSVAQPLETP